MLGALGLRWVISHYPTIHWVHWGWVFITLYHMHCNAISALSALGLGWLYHTTQTHTGCTGAQVGFTYTFHYPILGYISLPYPGAQVGGRVSRGAPPHPVALLSLVLPSSPFSSLLLFPIIFWFFFAIFIIRNWSSICVFRVHQWYLLWRKVKSCLQNFLLARNKICR